MSGGRVPGAFWILFVIDAALLWASGATRSPRGALPSDAATQDALIQLLAIGLGGMLAPVGALFAVIRWRPWRISAITLLAVGGCALGTTLCFQRS